MVEALFEEGLKERDGARQHQVDHAGRGEHGEELEVLPDDLLAAEGELVDEDHRGDGGALDHADGIVGHARQDGAHGLRQDDPPQRQKRPHAERRRRDRLVAIDRQDAAANDFGAEGGLVQGKADDRRREGVELDADAGKGIVEKDQLQKLGRSAHEPDIDPGRGADRRVRRQTHERQAEAEEDTADHRQRRDLHGKQRAFQEEGKDDVAQELAQPAGLALADRRAAAGELGQCGAGSALAAAPIVAAQQEQGDAERHDEKREPPFHDVPPPTVPTDAPAQALFSAGSRWAG